MLEMCVQKETDENGKKRYVVALDEEIGQSFYIMRQLKKAVVRLGDRFWSNYWEPAELCVFIKQYLPDSEIAKCSLDEIEKALHFGVALELCVTHIRMNAYPEPASVYRIL